MELPKRKRRPSVRLGEIGELGFTASPWLESPPQRRRKQPTTTTSNQEPPEEESVVAAAASPVAKRRSRTTEPRKKVTVRGRQENDDDDDDATLNPENRAAMSSDSDRDLDGANPNNSHGHDEMQGAIEDSGLGFRNGATVVVTTPSCTAGVSGWLQELGLGKYSELFKRNEVDTDVLPLLTLDDLREMGVDAVGARRKMFSNIQELGQLR